MTLGSMGFDVTVGSISVGVRVSVAVEREMEDVPRDGCNVGEGGSPRTSRATPGMFCTASTAAIPAVTRQIVTSETMTRIQRFRVVVITPFPVEAGRLASLTSYGRAAIIPRVITEHNPSPAEGCGAEMFYSYVLQHFISFPHFNIMFLRSVFGTVVLAGTAFDLHTLVCYNPAALLRATDGGMT